MRPTFLVCLIATCCTVAASGRDLTVVLDPGQSNSRSEMPASTRDELQRELNTLFKAANLNIGIKLRKELMKGETFDDIVVVRMSGTCRMVDLPHVFDERGPYAWAHTSDGTVLPFVELRCDNVRRSVGEALWTVGLSKTRDRDRLFGRALARIIAHEVVHIKGETHQHGNSGVFRTALKAADLVSENIAIDEGDLSLLPSDDQADRK